LTLLIGVFPEPSFDGTTSISNLHACLPQVMIEGAYTVSSLLRDQGIRHVIVGAMAVACNGYLRSIMLFQLTPLRSQC
jgi:hypothetical protein